MPDRAPREHHDLAAEEPVGERDSAVAGDIAGRPAAAEHLRLQSTLLEAQQEIRDRQLAMQVIRNELARARQDLQAERAHHIEAAERFLEDLAQLRTLADEANAEEERVNGELATRLGEVEDAIAHLREELESSAERLALAHAQVQELQVELQRRRPEREAAVTAPAGPPGATAEARTDAKRLLDRLQDLAKGLGAPRARNRGATGPAPPGRR